MLNWFTFRDLVTRVLEPHIPDLENEPLYGIFRPFNWQQGGVARHQLTACSTRNKRYPPNYANHTRDFIFTRKGDPYVHLHAAIPLAIIHYLHSLGHIQPMLRMYNTEFAMNHLIQANNNTKLTTGLIHDNFLYEETADNLLVLNRPPPGRYPFTFRDYCKAAVLPGDPKGATAILEHARNDVLRFNTKAIMEGAEPGPSLSDLTLPFYDALIQELKQPGSTPVRPQDFI